MLFWKKLIHVCIHIHRDSSFHIHISPSSFHICILLGILLLQSKKVLTTPKVHSSKTGREQLGELSIWETLTNMLYFAYILFPLNLFLQSLRKKNKPELKWGWPRTLSLVLETPTGQKYQATPEVFSSELQVPILACRWRKRQGNLKCGGRACGKEGAKSWNPGDLRGLLNFDWLCHFASNGPSHGSLSLGSFISRWRPPPCADLLCFSSLPPFQSLTVTSAAGQAPASRACSRSCTALSSPLSI